MKTKNIFGWKNVLVVLTTMWPLWAEDTQTEKPPFAQPLSQQPPPSNTVTPPETTSALTPPISNADLMEFGSQPLEIQKLIVGCLELTGRKLRYQYGSADPTNGGMDCSGFVYYMLGQQGIKNVPRQSNTLYLWVRMADNFRAVLSHNQETPELNELKPGDLMFWTGTYNIEHDPPVTHVMIYLGRLKSNGRRVMVGSSEGRRFMGKSKNGVTVFDFDLPTFGRDEPRFVGYGAIPNWIKKPEPPIPDPLKPSGSVVK